MRSVVLGSGRTNLQKNKYRWKLDNNNKGLLKVLLSWFLLYGFDWRRDAIKDVLGHRIYNKNASYIYFSKEVYKDLP